MIYSSSCRSKEAPCPFLYVHSDQAPPLKPALYLKAAPHTESSSIIRVEVQYMITTPPRARPDPLCSPDWLLILLSLSILPRALLSVSGPGPLCRHSLTGCVVTRCMKNAGRDEPCHPPYPRSPLPMNNDRFRGPSI